MPFPSTAPRPGFAALTPALPLLLLAATAAAGQGDLSVRVDDTLTHATPGRPVTYTITTRNAGPDAVDGLLIAATLPAASCIWSCSSDAGQCQTTPVPGANLPAGAEARHLVTCIVPVDAAGSWTASAVLQPPGDFTDTDPGNNQSSDTTQITRRGILRLTLTDAPSHVLAGDPVAYTLTVRNAGPDAISGARVATALPPQYSGCAWTCSTGSGGATCTGSGSGAIDDTGTYLPANSSVNYALNCTVSPGAGGTATTSASVRPPPGSVNIDPSPGNGADASDSNVILPGPVPDTAVELDGPAEIEIPNASSFWPLNYRLFAINRGAAATTVLLSADFGLTANWVCATPNCPIASGTGYQLRQTVTLPAHSRWEITAGFVGYGTGVYYASASLAAPPDDPVPGNNSGSVATVVRGPRPYPPPTDVGIALVSAPSQRVALGDTVHYRFRAAAPALADINATIVLPAYIHDALPACVATTGGASCTVLGTGPSLAGGNFTYAFRIGVDAGQTADFAVTAQVSRWPFADYWNEALRVTGGGIGSLDPDMANNVVTVDTPLTLFADSFETP